jgi:hypothetical protein
MFHPFGPATLKTVLHQLGNALRQRPRALRVIYHNPVHDDLLAAGGLLRRTDHWPASAGGYAVSFWQA